MKSSNPHFGSSLEYFLEAEGFLEPATQQAIADAAVWHRQRRQLQAACWVAGIACGLLTVGVGHPRDIRSVGCVSMSAEKMPAPWEIDGEHLTIHVANASFIVRAANCHDDLVAALNAHDAYMLDAGYEGPESEALHPKAAANWRNVRAALAKAAQS